MRVRGYRRARCLGVAVTLFLSMAATLVMSPASVAAASGATLSNIAPQPSFWPACQEDSNSASCIRLAVEAIESARASEHMRRLTVTLPDDFRQLDPAEQTFVLIDLERVDRGLRPLTGLVPELDQVALPAASRQVDPAPAEAVLGQLGVRRYRSLWASTSGPLASDYEWMYDDGYSSGGDSNVDCQSPGAAGCWAHRRAILAGFNGDPVLLAGAGSASQADGFESITAILAGGDGSSPDYVYTWRDALRHGADGPPTD